MSEAPWLTIVGVGEDGHEGLPPASRSALSAASVVMGPRRHLALVETGAAQRVEWPVPFADGLALLDGFRGRPTVVLASGDPFRFGAGSVLARRYPGEWRAIPGQSVFTLAAARLGWPLEETACLGLHAAPPTRMRPHLAPGARILATLRDGAAVAELASYLLEIGARAELTVLEALGGPRERVRNVAPDAVPADIRHPVAIAIAVATAPSLGIVGGRADAVFETDGQITKQPVRALTLSALAPRPGEHLWDIGAGSGSIAIEWLLAHPSLRATAVEARPDRAVRIGRNAAGLGVDHLKIVEGTAPDTLQGLDIPDVVFIGGGLSEALLAHLRQSLPAGTRIVANAVTLEGEALLTRARADLGGDLLRIELSRAAPLGGRTAWHPAYPVTQWSGTL